MNPKTNPTFSQHAPMKILPGCLEVWIFPQQNSSFGKTKEKLQRKKTREKISSRKLTYPPKMALLKIIFLFPRWDMLIPWRVSSLKPNSDSPWKWIPFLGLISAPFFFGRIFLVSGSWSKNPIIQKEPNQKEPLRLRPRNPHFLRKPCNDRCFHDRTTCVFKTAEC